MFDHLYLCLSLYPFACPAVPLTTVNLANTCAKIYIHGNGGRSEHDACRVNAGSEFIFVLYLWATHESSDKF
jgi:hypothetical protein